MTHEISTSHRHHRHGGGLGDGLTGLGGALLRGALAAWLLLLCAGYWPTTLTFDALAALPTHDFVAEARSLARQQRHDEALLVIDAGLQADVPQQAPALLALRSRVRAEHDSLPRRLRDLGHGALTGRGDSIEALSGAVIADLLVFGDVRDLVIEGKNALDGEPVDEVIVALSAVGLVLTVTPVMDVGAALLKFARRAGAMTARFARRILRLTRRAVRSGRGEAIADVMRNTGRLSRVARPKPAVRILRHVDTPADLARAARFATTPRRAHALLLGGDAAMDWLRVTGKSGERALLRAARKGPEGMRLLGRSGKLMLKAHPVLGVIKGVYKGNIPELLARSLAQWSSAIVGLLAAWLAVEVVAGGLRTRQCVRCVREVRAGRAAQRGAVAAA